MGEQIRVFPIGSGVTFGSANTLHGNITAICIRATGVTYEVVWWDGAVRHVEWLTSHEVIAHEATQAVDIGLYL